MTFDAFSWESPTDVSSVFGDAERRNDLHNDIKPFQTTAARVFLDAAAGKFGLSHVDRDNPSISIRDPHIKRTRFGETVLYEKEILQDVAHPHIIHCFGASECGTELMIERGEFDLYDHISSAEDNRLPDYEVFGIALAMTGALKHVHEHGYVHNDLKAENVVMVSSSEDGVYVPKLIDFEFSHHVEMPPPEGDHQVAGTTAYFSPEKYQEAEGIGESPVSYCRKAADMWSLGVTLHLAVFGRFPNGTGDPLPVLEEDFVASPSNVAPVLNNILEGLLKVDPRERWTAAAANSFLYENQCLEMAMTPEEASRLGQALEDLTGLDTTWKDFTSAGKLPRLLRGLGVGPPAPKPAFVLHSSYSPNM